MLAKNDNLWGKPRKFYRAISVVFGILIFVADELLPQGVSVGEAYSALVLIGLVGKDKPLILVSAIGGTILTIVGVFVSAPESQLWIVEINRVLSIFMVWLTAVFSLMLLKSVEQQEESEEIKIAYQMLKKETSFLKLNRDIAILVSTKQPIKDDIGESLRLICMETGWPVGHLYLMDNEKDILNPTGIWHLEDPKQFESFKKVTEATPLRFGEGLPGRVLASGKAEWIIDVSKDKNFPRARQAVEIGVRAGFAFPILIESKVIGVMEFFSEEALELDPKLLEVMESVGFLLGRIFERHQAYLRKEEYMEHLKSLYDRLDSVREVDDKRKAEGTHDKLKDGL